MDVAAKFDEVEAGHAWAWKPWTWFADGSAAGASVALVPLCGLAQHAPGAPLNQEEVLLTSILNRALHGGAPFLTLPVLRFVLGPSPACAFPVDPELFHDQLAELCASVAAAGVRKVVIVNASPWNEQSCDVAARDIRIGQGLQVFCVHLTGLGLRVAVPASATAVENAASRLRALLDEIRGRPALPEGGKIRPMEAP